MARATQAGLALIDVVAGEIVIHPPHETELRGFQYQLKWLFVVVTSTAVLLGLYAWNMRRLKEAREARRFYESIGTFYLDFVGEGLDFKGELVTDEQLSLLPKVLNLRAVILQNAAVTDGCLVYLFECSDLAYLDVRNTRVSADGIKRLHEKLPHCQIGSEFESSFLSWLRFALVAI